MDLFLLKPYSKSSTTNPKPQTPNPNAQLHQPPTQMSRVPIFAHLQSLDSNECKDSVEVVTEMMSRMTYCTYAPGDPVVKFREAIADRLMVFVQGRVVVEIEHADIDRDWWVRGRGCFGQSHMDGWRALRLDGRECGGELVHNRLILLGYGSRNTFSL
jgi:hypothetical protein